VTCLRRTAAGSRVSTLTEGTFYQGGSCSRGRSSRIGSKRFRPDVPPDLRSRGEGLVRLSSRVGGTRCTLSVIRRGLRSPRLPTRRLGGWTPPRRFGTPTRDVAPPPRGTPNPHLVDRRARGLIPAGPQRHRLKSTARRPAVVAVVVAGESLNKLKPPGGG